MDPLAIQIGEYWTSQRRTRFQTPSDLVRRNSVRGWSHKADCSPAETRLRALKDSLRNRSSLRVVRSPSRTIRPWRRRTSFTPCALLSSPPFRKLSMRKTRRPGKVRNASRAHFSTRCGGTIAIAVKGLPSLWTWTAPREISAFPVPHSATIMPVRACCQRFASPMMAIACAGKGCRRRSFIRGESGLSTR
jgi:hypothetical protein